jgi:hypothetical protein
MTLDNTACYYGRHFGCVNVLQNPDCRLCAERLTHAVNQVVRQTTASTADAPLLRLEYAVKIPRQRTHAESKQV